MNNTKTVSTTSFPLFSILGLIFIVLKLTGYITWSWWWVLSPFWIPLVAILAVLGIILLLAIIFKK